MTVAVSHRTSTPVFQTGTGNRTVTPDAATAVGEFMLLVVAFQDSSATTISTPSGWTLLKNAVLTGTLKTSIFSRTRQSGDASWTFAPSQSVETAHIVLSVPGGDPAAVIAGADGTRSASGGTNATTAPTVTTTVAASRVFVISTERTTANETVEATVNNSFTKILHTFLNGSSAESIFLGYRDFAAPGPTGATTVTFQNSQATNGYAVQVAVAPTASNVAAAGTVVVVSATAGTARTRQAARGTSAVASSISAIANTRHAAAGRADAGSSATGSAETWQAGRGVAAARSVVSGAAHSRQGAAGTVNATSATAGSASTTPPVEGASGTVDAAATVTGAASSTHRARVRLDAVSTVTGAALALMVAAGVIPATSTGFGRATTSGTPAMPPLPDVRTLTDITSMTLTDLTPTRTLTDLPVQHLLEDA